jgi:hypothetical protein
VIPDYHLADFYGVTTSALNQAVKRNADRFPEDFAFQLAEEEFSALMSQSVTSKGRGGRRKRSCLRWPVETPVDNGNA